MTLFTFSAITSTFITALPPPSYKNLVFSDEFNGTYSDFAFTWTYLSTSRINERLKDDQRQLFDQVRQAVIKDGNLNISLSDKFSTNTTLEGNIGWTYGYFEIRVKLPRGHNHSNHLHVYHTVDIQLTPVNRDVYGKIHMPYYDGTMYSVSPSIVFGSENDWGFERDNTNWGYDLGQDFHLFGLEWTNTSMTWYFDDKPYFDVSLDRFFESRNGNRFYHKKGSPFDQDFKFKIIMNTINHEKIANLEEPTTWETVFDYVRVYQK